MIATIKSLLQNSRSVNKIGSSVYNLIFSRLTFRSAPFSVKRISGAFCRMSAVSITRSSQFELTVGRGAALTNCKLVIYGSGGGKLTIGENCRFYNTTFWIDGNGSTIIIGNNTTMQGGQIAALEGHTVTIGNDCMFSHSIEIRTGDSHGIFDNDGQRINMAKDITIEDHVWLGAKVTVLKGSCVPHGSVVGNASIVTKPLTTPAAIYVGSPAQQVKENIQWSPKLTLKE